MLVTLLLRLSLVSNGCSNATPDFDEKFQITHLLYYFQCKDPQALGLPPKCLWLAVQRTHMTKRNTHFHKLYVLTEIKQQSFKVYYYKVKLEVFNISYFLVSNIIRMISATSN